MNQALFYFYEKILLGFGYHNLYGHSLLIIKDSGIEVIARAYVLFSFISILHFRESLGLRGEDTYILNERTLLSGT